MAHYTYLIIGGGMAAKAAVEGIRTEDKNGSIGIITAEEMIPYDRPPLSKSLWTDDDTKPKDIISDVLKRPDVEVHVNRRVTHIDPTHKRVRDGHNTLYEYDKLLIATGSRPRRLPFDKGQSHIIYYRTLADYYRLRSLAQTKRRIGVIGGGFIGSELAYVLTEEGNEVTMLFPEDGIAARVLPEELSELVTEEYTDRGVTVMTNQTVTNVERDFEDSTFVITTEEGETVVVDVVVAGIGVIPNTILGEKAGLTVDDGIEVDAHLQSSHEDIYAAGDVARFFSPDLDEWVRVEHENNANLQGELAGRNMAGANDVYDTLPFFYSDMFDMGYEAVGKLNSSLDTTIHWHDDQQQAAIVYRDDEGTIRGMMTWNAFGHIDRMRELIGTQTEDADILETSPA